MKNDGTQPHEIAFYRVNDGVDPANAVAFLTAATPRPGPPPFASAGGITAMQSGQVAGIDLDLKPGKYVIACFLPDAVGGVPHFAHGMIQVIDVPA